MVSFIVIVYNGEKYIDRCLGSIFSQDYKDYEVVVVNDGSTDHSLEILKTYKDRIRIISQYNQGVASARNTGIINALGEYVCFIDIDDYIESNYLSLLFHSLDDDIQCSFAGYKRKIGDVLTPFDNVARTIEINNDYDILNTFIPRLTSGIIKTELAKSIMFDKNCDVAYDDYLFQIKLLSKINKAKIISGTPYVFEYNKDSVTNNLNSYKIAKRTYLNAYCAKEIVGIIKDKSLQRSVVKNSVNTFIVYICNCYKWNINIDKGIYDKNVSLLKELKPYMPWNVMALFIITRHFPKLVSRVYAIEKKRK